MLHCLTVTPLLCVCLIFGGLLSHAVAETRTVAASRAKGRAGPDAAAARPTRGLEVVSIRDRQGQPAILYRASYALVIGVSGYTDWPRLPGVLQDLTAVTTVFEAQGFQVEQVRDPTLDDLRRAFDNFINQYGQVEDHRLLIYFAGHGHTLKPKYGGEMGYIVPVDAPNPQRDEAGFRARALSMQEMETYARRIDSKHVLFLFDSCFSGAIFALSRAVPDYITYKTSRPVRQFITSGQADETVSDVSIFRQQLVAALQGEADQDGDGYVTGAELGEFLQQKVTNYSRNAQHPQYGKLRDPYLDKGDFVFTVARATPLEPSAPSVADLQAQAEAQRQQGVPQKLQAEQDRRRPGQEKLQGGGSPQGTQVAVGVYPQPPTTPTQQYRRALVIGNTTYPDRPLANPANDATDMAALLRRLGFDVTLLRDADKATMERAVEDFTRGVPRGSAGLLFFAGNGFQVAGVDLLAPISTYHSSNDVQDRTIAVSWILERMDKSGMDVKLLIIDTCRHNPFGDGRTQTPSQGLAIMHPSKGSFIAYSTSPGQLASDGTGRNSPYTAHLLREISVPGHTIQLLFQKVREGVYQETNGQQIPWESSSLIGDFIFAR